MVLSSGGVSVGDYDYVDQILADLGAEIHCRAVTVKPGKPLTVATFPSAQGFQSRSTLCLRLAGKSRFRSRQLLALCAACAQQTFWPISPDLGSEICEGAIAQDLRADGQRETYLWGSCTWLMVSTNLIWLAGVTAQEI